MNFWQILGIEGKELLICFDRHFLGPGTLQPSPSTTMSLMGVSDDTEFPASNFLIISPLSSWKIPSCQLLELEMRWGKQGVEAAYDEDLFQPRLLTQNCTCCPTTTRRQKEKSVDYSSRRTFPCLGADLRPG